MCYRVILLYLTLLSTNANASQAGHWQACQWHCSGSGKRRYHFQSPKISTYLHLAVGFQQNFYCKPASEYSNICYHTVLHKTRTAMLLHWHFLLLLLLNLFSHVTSLPDASLLPLLAVIPPHPRILLNSTEFITLQSTIASSTTAALYATNLIAAATSLLTSPLTPFTNCTAVGLCRGPEQGGYLDAPAASNIIITCAMAWRLTNNISFFNRSKLELLHVSLDWSSWYWPVGEALERSEIAYGVSIGYDWLYNDLNIDERTKIAATLRVFAIDTRLRDGREDHWWVRGTSGGNWQINANAPLLAVAVALLDAPGHETAAALLWTQLLTDLATGAILLWGQDGVWPEGDAYAGYSLTSLAQGCSALTSANLLSNNNTDLVCNWLKYAPGVCESTRAAIAMSTGPTGTRFNWADSSPGSPPIVPMRYSAIVCHQPYFAAAANILSGGGGGSNVFDLIWYTYADPAILDTQPLNVVYADTTSIDSCRRRKTHLGSFRSALSWPGRGGNASTKAVVLFFKGGSNLYDIGASNNHGHLDIGSFVFESAGYRWAIDFPHDSYDYPLLNNFGRFRWGYSLVGSSAHNVLQIGTDLQSHIGTGNFISYDINNIAPFAIVNATTGYGGTKSVLRTFRLFNNATTSCAKAVISDSWILNPGDWGDIMINVTWQMLTTALPSVTESGIMLTAPNASGVNGTQRQLLISAITDNGSTIIYDSHVFTAPPPQTQTYNNLPVYVITVTVDSTAGGISVELQPQLPCI